MAQKDYYKILELTDEDKKLVGDDFIKRVKSNYRKLCKQFHPDKFANKSDSEKKEAEEKFKEITEAYDVLSTPEKRQKYDRLGTSDGFNFDFDGFGNTGMDDIDEMLNRFRSGAFNPFGGGFGFGMNGFGHHAQPTEPRKPQNLNIKLHVSVEDIYNGSSKKIRYKRMVPCSHCGGKGTEDGGKIEMCPVCGGVGQVVRTEQRGPMMIQQTVPCDNCHGTGKVVTKPCKYCKGSGREVVTEELDIQIPAGAVNGLTFILPGKGNYAERSNSVVGDMAVSLVVDPSDKFGIANQYDLYTYLEIPVLDCITGCKVEVQLFGGKKVSVDIPRLTKEGKVLRLNGLGLPLRNGGRGSLLVEVKQKYPKDINHSEEKLIKELKESKNFR